jgi:hypothetical protein
MQMLYNPKDVKSRWGASVSKEVHRRYQGRDRYLSSLDGNKLYTAKVDCYPLQSLFLAANLTTIHFCSLDLEGVELKALKTIDWKRIDIKASMGDYPLVRFRCK